MKIKSTRSWFLNENRALKFIMKTFILLFCATIFSMTPKNTFSQERVIIDQDQLVTVNQVFKIIKEQTNYRFIYPKKIFNNSSRIQLKQGEILVEKLLKQSSLSGNFSFEISENNRIKIKEKPLETIGSLQFQVEGIVSDSNGQPLPGANIIEKGTTNGAQTDFDGKFSIEVSSEDAILVISYIGFSSKEVTVKGGGSISVALEESSAQLDEIVVTGGIRSSELRAIAVKRLATSVVEAISPQDIGNFSDENIGDALRRVPGVQIQEDQTGGQDGGSRVSVRGIGPAFVGVTVNGRQPLSSGVEGIGRFRQFNVDVLPPEILYGAQIYKTSEAGLVEPGLGGLVNFNTLRPLDTKYEEGRNFFGAVNVRGEIDSQHDAFFTPTPRISAIIGGKTKDNKLGAYASFLTSYSERARDQIFSRVVGRDLKEDTNNNGIWDGAAGGDTEFLDVITPNSVTLNPIREENTRLAFSSAIEWEPSDAFHVIADFQYSKLDNESTRSQTRPQNGNDATGVISTTKVFEPGSLNIVDGFLQSYDTTGAFDSTTGLLSEGSQLLYQTVWFDNFNELLMGGINATYEKNGWKIEADYGASQNEYNQILVAGGRSTLGAFIDVDGPFQFDNLEYPSFTLGAESQNAFANNISSNGVGAPVANWNRFTRGETNAFKLDFHKEIDDSFSIDFGTRIVKNDIFVASIIRNGANISDFIANNNGGTVPVVGNEVFGENVVNFLPGNDFALLNNWPSLNYDSYQGTFSGVFNYDPGSHPLFDNGVDILEANDIIDETIANGTDDGFRLLNGPLFQVEEKTFALYTQVNFKSNLGDVPVSGNFGVRGVRTEYTGKAFTTVTLSDPLDEVGGEVSLGSVKSEVNDSGWEFLPSLNLKFELNPNLNYRISAVKTMTRPEFSELQPGGSLSAVNTLSSTFDGAGGVVSLPNTNLKPFTTWQIDNTVEWYNQYGGAVVFSAFYKEIFNFIANQTISEVEFSQVLEDGGFDIEALTGAGVLDDFENTTYTVTQPDNVGNAQVYGFEVGVNQPLSIISNSLRNFGVQANYNFVTANFNDDEINSDDAFPGTSKHNFNTVAYFENDKFGLRAAYNVRSNFLRTLSGQGLTALPEFTEGRGQLDLRGNYNVAKNAQFSVSIQNVTGTDQRSFFRNNPQESFQLISLEPIFTFGFRYGF